MNANQIIKHLNLQKHPEGGFYKETYRDNRTVRFDKGEKRSSSTAIYYMLTDDDKSHFHRVKSDELWFFHQGESLEIFIIDENGDLKVEVLGNSLDKGECLQVVVKRNLWFAAKIKKSKGFSLVSCTVSPGFEFKDFELAKRHDLLLEYPKLQREIEELTY